MSGILHPKIQFSLSITPVYQVKGDGTQKSYGHTLDLTESHFFRISVKLLPTPQSLSVPPS
jgi:hypothetical protein